MLSSEKSYTLYGLVFGLCVFLNTGSIRFFRVSFFALVWCIFLLAAVVSLTISTSATGYLKRLVPEMSYLCVKQDVNSARSLCHFTHNAFTGVNPSFRVIPFLFPSILYFPFLLLSPLSRSCSRKAI